MDNNKDTPKKSESRQWAKKSERENYAENRMYEQFGELIIKRIKAMKEEGQKSNNWEMPWIRASTFSMPESIYGKNYRGVNALMLSLLMMEKGYKIPIFATFENLHFMDYKRDEKGRFRLGNDKNGNKLPQVHVEKGEKAFPVYLTTLRYLNDKTLTFLTPKEYENLSDEDKKKYRSVKCHNVYFVFNVEQSNLATARPELWKKWTEKYINKPQEKYNQHPEEMYSHPVLDRMVKDNLYICPIICEESNSAYYHLVDNEIHLPEKRQFKNGNHYYSTMLHEMAHATGQKALFDRFKEGKKAYAREELVAELTSAFVAAKNGITKTFSDEIREELERSNDYYLMSWLGALKEDPTYLKTVLTDMKDASEFIDKKMEATIKLIESENEGKSISPKKLGLGPLEAKDSGQGEESEQEEVEGEEERKQLVGIDMDGNGQIDPDEQNEEKEKKVGRRK